MTIASRIKDILADAALAYGDENHVTEALRDALERAKAEEFARSRLAGYHRRDGALDKECRCQTR